ASTIPATNGASGPTMVSATRSVCASRRSAAMSSASTPMLRTRGSAAVPALPGATRTSVTRAAPAHFQASACSRPPPPTIRTFMAPHEIERCAPGCRNRLSRCSNFVGTPPQRYLASVTEVPHAGKHHRHVVLIRCGDDLGVAPAAAGLNDGADAEAGGNIDIVTEGEEGIGSHYCSGKSELLIGCLHRREARRVHTAHLARTHPERCAAAREDDRVRLDEPAHAPREAQIRELFPARLASARHGPCLRRRIGAIGRLREESAGDAAVLELAARGGREIPEQEHAHVRLARE